VTDSLRERIAEASYRAWQGSSPLSFAEQADDVRDEYLRAADALLPVVQDPVTSETDRLIEKLRAMMPVGALWRIVLGPQGAPEYWPLAPNTSASQVAMLLADARLTWPDARAESRGVGPWRESDPTETAPATSGHTAPSGDDRSQK